MNERVYDIALEVLKDYPVIESWTFNNRELEEFTRLILEECIKIMQSQKVDLEPYPTSINWNEGIWNSAIQYTVSQVSLHFGVNTNT